MARKAKSVKARGGLAEERQTAFGADRQFVELGAGGRLVIPAAFRSALGMKPGDKLTMRLEGNELRVYTRREGIRRAQELARKYLPDGLSLADELIAERRADAAKELKEAGDE